MGKIESKIAEYEAGEYYESDDEQNPYQTSLNLDLKKPIIPHL